MTAPLRRSAPGLLAAGLLAFAPEALALPVLEVQTCLHSDECSLLGPGHRDGEVEPGEDVALTLFLTNSGDEDATNVAATVSTATPLVSVTQPATSFGTIPIGGLVSGIPSVEYSVDAGFPCGTDIVLDVAITSDQGDFIDACQLVVPMTCDVCTAGPPALRIGTCSHADSCGIVGAGDMNGEVEPGEDVSLSISLANDGGGEATGVLGTLSTSNPLVNITQNLSDWGDIPGFGIGNGSPAFAYTVDEGFPCGTDIVFDLDISTDQGDFSDGCQVTVPVACVVCAATPPDLRLASCSQTDDCSFGGPGDANAEVEPGEDVAMSLVLQNFGGTEATNVTALVSTATPLVSVTQPNATFGAISAFGIGSAAMPIEYAVDAAFPCGTEIVFDVEISSDQGDFDELCRVNVPVACTVCELTPTALALGDCMHVDACSLGGPGDGNGEVEPGETVELLLVARNDGATEATGVSASVSTATPLVTVIQANAAFGDVPGFGSANALDAVEYVVDASFPCGTSIDFDVELSSDQGDFLDACSVSVAVACTPCASVPYISVAGCTPIDDCALGGAGDGDGFVDPGESVSMTLALHNSGSQIARNVMAIVSTANSLVAVTQSDTDFGDLGPGATGVGVPSVAYTVDPTFPCGEDIVFDVAIGSDEGPFLDSCSITVPIDCNACVDAAILFVASCEHVDSCSAGGPGDGDSEVEPGEDVSLTLSLRNAGTRVARNVSATVTTATPLVMISQADTSFADIAAGATADGAPAIEYRVDPAFPCGDEIVFDVEISSDDGSFMDDCRVTVPVVCEPCAGDPPGEVPWLLPRCLPSAELEIEWMPAPDADTHDIHQGTIAGLGLVPGAPWDHACVLKDRVAPFVAIIPGTTCGDGLDAYFLVVGRNASGVGSYGRIDTDGDTVPDRERDPGPPCP